MKYDCVKGYCTMMDFGEWLRAARTSKGYSYRTLAKRANNVCTFGYISQIESGVTGKNGKPFQPDLEIVDALAAALGKDIDEARLAAGYAPRSLTAGRPESLDELMALLERAGIDHIEFADRDKFADASPDDLEKVLDSIRIAVEVALQQIRRTKESPANATRTPTHRHAPGGTEGEKR